MKMLYCKDCGEFRPEEDFSSNVNSKTGFAFYCKKHAALRQKNWKKENAVKVKAAKKDYYRRKKNSE